MNKPSSIRPLIPLSIATAALMFAIRQKRSRRIRSGQVAIVTGGSSGLGLALAHELGRAGLKLVLAARDGADLEAARHELLSTSLIRNENDILLVPAM